MSVSTGLAEVRLDADPVRCLFCARSRRYGSLLCGESACAAGYNRAWHADKRRTHPERYGSAFYRARARGSKSPTRRPKSKRWYGPSRPERLESVRAWLEGRWYGATKAQLLEEFVEFYPDFEPHTACERRFYRDREELLADGRLVYVGTKFIRADRVKSLSDGEEW